MFTMYLCFLAGGAILPLVSTIFGFFGDGADADIGSGDGLDIDAGSAFNLEVGDGLETGFDLDTDLDVDLDVDVDLDGDIGIETDFGSAFSLGLLPTSLMAISTLAITFGAVGSILTYSGKGRLITLIISVIAGYASSVVIQTIVKTLKRIQTRSYGLDENELLMYDGKIVETILPGQLGSVSFTTLSNVKVSYPARCTDQELRLETGRVVKVKLIENGIFIVEPKNKYE